jgi:adenylate cyclase
MAPDTTGSPGHWAREQGPAAGSTMPGRRPADGMTMDAGDFHEHGLYDPKADNAHDRLALLKHLDRIGVPLADIKQAIAGDELFDVAGHKRLAPGELSADELCERTGLERDELERIWKWAGLPPRELEDNRFSDDDVVMLVSFLTIADLTDEETALSILRVFGTAFARMADVMAVAYLSKIEPKNADSAEGELHHARANTNAIASLGSSAEGISSLLSHHLRWSLRRMRTSRRDVEGFETADMAVGFVDLVGYTALSQRLTTRELAQLMAEFEATAHEAVIARDGRLVKLIGDAVMYVAVDAEPAIDIALRLVEAFEERSEQIVPSGGVAVGELLTRGADYYGSVVNVASRITDLAVPNEILVTNDVYLRIEFAGADAGKTLGPGRRGNYDFEGAGRRTLKGFDDPVKLFSVTRRH